MSEYQVSKVYPNDQQTNQQIDALLELQGIRRDNNLDYTCVIYDDNYTVIATGSCFMNTLRCLAVSQSYQGEGHMNTLISHLINYQFDRGYTHLFLYTKVDSAKFFQDFGFYEIARVTDQLVFMENRKNGFSDYLNNLIIPRQTNEKIAGIVINANPFTNGHLYLIEKAAAENDIVHLFIVSEDVSLIPFAIRKQLIMAGTAHLNNIAYHDSGPYMISNATFPSYFQKDEQSVITSHALLDITIFRKIAQTLAITRRYVGEEPHSQVTGIYNQSMQQELPKVGIECIVIPRKSVDGTVISASTIRQAIKDDMLTQYQAFIPKTTYDFFTSPEAETIIQKIKATDNVIHY